VPCSDITEVIELQLDHDDRLTAYALTKRTCGAEIGRASLLADLLVDLGAHDLATLTGEEVAAHYGAQPVSAEFLAAKHLVAVRQAARVYLGHAAGAAGDPCALASVTAHPDGITVRAALRIDLLTGEIEACAKCCGARRQPKAGGNARLPVVAPS